MAGTIKVQDLKDPGAATDEFPINDVAGGNVDKKLRMDGIRIIEIQITDLQAYILADSTDTLTNKTFDANATGNSLSNVDVADLANGTDGELITWDAAGAPDTVAVGTSGHVLTSNGIGTAPTFQASGASTPIFTPSTSYNFADISGIRYTTAVGGGGTASSIGFGASLVTTASATAFSRVTISENAQWLIFTANNRYFFRIVNSQQGTDYKMFWGIGSVKTADGSTIDYTGRTAGFKSIRASSGTVVISATNANNTSETATSIVETNELADYYMETSSSGSIKFYYKAAGDLTYELKATHTTNIYSSGLSTLHATAVSNVDVASQSIIAIASFAYQQEAVA